MMIEVSRPPEYASTTFSDIRFSLLRYKSLSFRARGAIQKRPESRNLALSRFWRESAVSHQQQHDRLLHMQTILCLIEHHRLRRVDHLISHFIATMRW